MNEEYEAIYLEPECAGPERCWCENDQGPCDDCGAPWVKYVRADTRTPASCSPDVVERVTKRIYANPHHLMRVTGSEAQAAYEQTAKAVIDQLSLESMMREKDAMVERLEQIVSAWAFAHDIDGAARNDLFARLRAALDMTLDKGR
jgi:hypothetical protein